MPEEEAPVDARQPAAAAGAPPPPASSPPRPRYPPPHPGYPPPHPGYPPPQTGDEQPPPGYEQPPPGYEQAPPGYEQASPGYEQASPGYEQAPAPAGPHYPPPGAAFGFDEERDTGAAGSSTRRRRRRVALIVTAVVVIAGLLAGGGVALFGGSGTTNAVSPSAPTSPAARAVLGTALANAEQAGSFHYVAISNSGNGSFATVGDAGSNSGRQQITTRDPRNGTAAFNVIVVGTTAYFRGDATAMQENLNVSPASAAAHANQWISLVATDGSVYYSVYAAVNTRDALRQNISFKPQVLGSTSAGGRRLQTVRGTLLPVNIPGQGTQNISGTGTLSVSTTDHLPVRYVEDGFSGRQRTSFTMTFDHFGEAVDEAPPAGAVSYSSIGGPSGGGGGGGGGSPTPTYLT